MPAIKTAVIAAAFLSTTGSAFALEADIRATPDGSETPSIVGVTNLPDNTKLLISLRRKEAGYSAQSSTVVRGNQFRTEHFSAFGKPLAPGEYTLEVTMPIPRVQSEGVRQVIGENGEQLEGKLVNNGPLGTTLKTLTVVNIGGPASPSADNAVRQDQRTSMQKWRKDSCEWISQVTQHGQSVEDCVRTLSQQ